VLARGRNALNLTAVRAADCLALDDSISRGDLIVNGDAQVGKRLQGHGDELFRVVSANVLPSGVMYEILGDKLLEGVEPVRIPNLLYVAANNRFVFIRY
jgi:hypothetical protein